MHILYLFFLFLSSCLAADTVSLEGLFSILEDYFGETAISSPAANSTTVRVGFDRVDQRLHKDWLFTRVDSDRSWYTIKHPVADGFIHFPEIKAGAQAVVTPSASSFFEVIARSNARFTIQPVEQPDPNNPLYWYVGEFRSGEERVLRLKGGRHDPGFSLIPHNSG
ncbi:hypothetical protein D8B26_007160 [Coccidioides posadasii str. Silveira]|uniref:Uncharacterized protein n=3 Tax=Coccidioides posadasii TaxID=199306 RepID=E9D4G9_COCPS|nr:hypothetical protein CPC735_012190 [Coccidioides posadasii C735 delta SOWgp]EER29901.1 hypothetical protein CPC735_012190 [Coccidioides posadasii C735 delta SOWgp]EFW18962.1 conserved hypothetical protein [Coccidioides posadasii str. Silveira]KMM71303.1 hypothetical protein CPAG_07610 [Coccidioides posadasii RMSCC 3488]QVM12537.1 hypothetical protein D8B26_007160 [Coccidioides posadasii str. Silveira]|eukprot:XP_003072046.1 hypothetical protein CPC735_012190 [Coccidioides posadasii C735 delta SOWgp]